MLTPLIVGLLTLASVPQPSNGQLPEVAAPAELGMSDERLKAIDDVVAEGLRRGQMPGCVVAVGRREGLVMLKAYGHRQLRPTREPMTTDTVFDLASLTKPLATASSVMKLIEQGKLRLDDPVSLHLPEFGAQGKQSITVAQLLTHQGGLIADNSLRDYEQGPEEAIRRIYDLKPTAEPGAKFIYSDVGFIVLGKLVEKLSGESMAEFAQRELFKPLGMDETGFLPPASLRARAATTQQRDGQWMRGEVHDPRAHRLGGVAGHAGLFSTAGDLSRFARMLLGEGALGEARVLKAETVALMTRPVPVPAGLRGLGWDIRTGYSINRGDLFSSQAFGHGGFTGTTFWVDPGHDLLVIFLSNRVHPDGEGSVNRLAGRIGTIAAAAVTPK